MLTYFARERKKPMEKKTGICENTQPLDPNSSTDTRKIQK